MVTACDDNPEIHKSDTLIAGRGLCEDSAVDILVNDGPDRIAEIIADGMHLPPELLRLIVKTKDNSKISLVTDSMRGATMPEGPSVLGSRKDGLNVIIEDGIAKMLDFSGYAGSVATTDRLVRTMVNEAGLELHEAVNMMSLHPARLLKKENELGSIEAGKLADLVLLDDSITAKAVWVGGVKVTL